MQRFGKLQWSTKMKMIPRSFLCGLYLKLITFSPKIKRYKLLFNFIVHILEVHLIYIFFETYAKIYLSQEILAQEENLFS